MGKETPNQKNLSSRGNKPYDVSNSFVRKVANRVSGLFGGLFSTPEVNSIERPDEPSHTIVPDLSDSEIPSVTRVGTLDFASPISTLANEQSKGPKEKVNSPEPIAGPSRLQPRYENFDSFKFGCDRRDNVTPSSSFSGLHHLSRLDKTPDTPLPSYSGFQLKFSKYDLPKEDATQPIRSRSLTAKLKVDLDENRGSTPTPGSSKVARLDNADVKGTGAGDDHSESSESTSGCSSLVPQADRLSQSAFTSRRKSLALDEKLSYARQLKQSRNSMYLNRSIPVHAEAPRPSRTPSFDVSAYGKPILNKSVRETMLSSPFYTGHTTYGGAAASRRNSLGPPTASNARSQISVKPAQPQEGSNMSQTARRILAALEEFSTPLNDVRRIPTSAPPLAVKRRNAEPPASDRAKRPALTVPTVADMLKMRRLEQIQDSTTMARQIASSSTTREPSPPRRSGKIVTKMKNRNKPRDDPAPPPPDLPKIPLECASLPKLDLPLLSVASSSVASSAPSFTFSVPSALPSVASSLQATSSPPVQFNLAPPTPITDWLKSSGPSQPSSVVTESGAKLKKTSDDSQDNGTVVPAMKSNEGVDSLQKSLSKPSHTVDTKLDSTMCFGSSGFGDKFISATGSWTCDTCLLVNKPDVTSCMACESKRVDKAVKSANSAKKDGSFPLSGFGGKPTAFKDATPRVETPLTKSLRQGFGDKFKRDPGSWSCGDCLVQNKADSMSCVACTAIKPETKVKDDSKINADLKQPGFGNMFKADPGTWSCGDCMVQNKSESMNCVACTAKKPETKVKDDSKINADLKQPGFGNMFKADPGTWSCDDCMVQNKADSMSCVACTAKKPGTTGKDLKQTGSWNCGVCLISNEDSCTRCKSCDTIRPNGPLTTAPKFDFGLFSGGFKFGIDKAGVDVKAASNGPVPDKVVQPASVPVSVGPFTFGIPKELPVLENKSIASPKVAVTSPPDIVSENPPIKTSESSPSVTTSTPNFNFGLPRTESKPVSIFPGFALNGPLSTLAEKSQPSVVFSPPVVTTSLATSVTKPAPVEPPKPVPAPFIFGSNAGKSSPNLFAFGAQTNTEPKPFPSQNKGFNFGPFSSSTNPPTTASTASPAPFGTIASPTATAPTFGISSTTSFNAPVSAFGSTTVSSGTNFSFGSNTTPAPAFGTPATPSFGANSHTNAFGSSLTAPTTQNSAPAFGAFGASAPPAFGAPITTPTAFGSAPPAFGTSATPTPMFGAANTPSFGPGFGAGGTTTPFGTASQAAFGQTAAPPPFPSATPFQFGSSSTGAASPLSLSVPSSFNFTGGQTPTFSADPRSVAPEPRRKIIKAMRRTQK